MERRRVVITGLGAVTPIGLTAGESWQAVKNGVCGIGPITHYDPAAQKVKLAAEVKGFDPEALLGRQESKRMGRFTQFAVAAAREALSDAGFSAEQADPDRCGVILSSGIGGQAITETEHCRGLEKGFDRVSPFYVPTAICNMAAGQVAIDAGFRAMCSCPVTACAGGTNAVGDAFHYIRDGYADGMLCGGTEAAITPLAMGGFTSMKALSESQDPKRASIPFDAERGGFVMGEGSGALVLEELEECIPSSETVESALEAGCLREAIDRFLGTLPAESRAVFLRRYFYAEPVQRIAFELGFTQGKVKTLLFRARGQLKALLEKEELL